MRIVAISDTHNWLPDLPPGDVLVHCGDATDDGTVGELVKFNQWLQSVRHQFKKIIFVPGNHDKLFESDYHLAKSLFDGVEILIDQATRFEKFTFYGSPWVPAINGNWAFEAPTPAMIDMKWQRIPAGVDVLITHSPPLYILDHGLGCWHLTEHVKHRVKPKVHLFGHIHEYRGRKATVGDTTFYNCSMVTPTYPNYMDSEPMVIDL